MQDLLIREMAKEFINATLSSDQLQEAAGMTSPFQPLWSLSAVRLFWKHVFSFPPQVCTTCMAPDICNGKPCYAPSDVLPPDEAPGILPSHLLLSRACPGGWFKPLSPLFNRN